MGGIGRIPPKSYDNQGGAKFKTQVFIGNYTGSVRQVLALLMEGRFKENTYDLTHQNCNHFSDAFCRALCGKGIPGWINSASDVSNAVQTAYMEASTLCCPTPNANASGYHPIEVIQNATSNNANNTPVSTRMWECMKTFGWGFLGCLSTQVSQFVLEGKWSWKSVIAGCSIALICSSFVMFFGDLLTLHCTMALLDFFFFLAGITSLGFEYKDTLIPAFMLTYIKEELKIMCSPVGRATVYVVVGLLLLCLGQVCSIYAWIGFVELIAGILLYMSAKSAGEKLNAMKNADIFLRNDDMLNSLFNKHDVGDKQYLESHEVRKMCEELGHPMNGISVYNSIVMPFTAYGELETAIGILDKTNDGKVRFNEMSLWAVS